MSLRGLRPTSATTSVRSLGTIRAAFGSKSELDAIFARMYRLERADLEWILDSRSPGTSFPSLKQHELKRFGEYRTQRYVLDAFDQLERGEVPDLTIQTPAI